MEMKRKTMRIIADRIIQSIYKSLIDNGKKVEYIENLTNIDILLFEEGYVLSNQLLTNLDLKYITCFAIDMDVKDISLLFNVEPASVRTARYRIRKKIGKENSFKFLI